MEKDEPVRSPRVRSRPRNGLSISAIIPTWREANAIAEAVHMAHAIADEVIVVDAASPDRTAELATRAGAHVVHAPKGRGVQLDAGARVATGDVLLFLHADAHLPPEARGAMETALASPRIAGGNFRIGFACEGLTARAFDWAYHQRSKWLRIYYGDSALFLRRSAYVALGGFRPLPIFEDYELVRRLERTFETEYVDSVTVRVSARRFARTPLRTLLLWTGIQMLFSSGVSAHKLSRFYADVRDA